MPRPLSAWGLGFVSEIMQVSKLKVHFADTKLLVVCRVRRSYREGDPTWIDIANDRKLWTSLVYELFHDAKNY